MDAAPTSILLVAAPPAERRPGVRVVVVDTTWTARAGDDAIGLRQVAQELLAERDMIGETSARLDAWAESSGIAEAMTVDGTSYWFHDRLRTWLWLQEQTLWLGIIARVVSLARPAEIVCGAGTGDDIRDAARRIAARDGLRFRDERPTATEPGTGVAAATDGEPDAVPAPRPAALPPVAPAKRSLLQRVHDRLRPGSTRPGILAARVRRFGRESNRPLLVLLAHADQRIDTPAGPRLMNAYLGPIVERLAQTALAPVSIERRLSFRDDAGWAALTAPGAERRLPGDVLRLYGREEDAPAIETETQAVLARVAAIDVPVLVDGVDVGPDLVAQVLLDARGAVPTQLRDVRRLRRLFAEIRPAGILLADEYHRQDWLAAAAGLGVPTVAIQHGLIYAHHNGYMHGARPDALRLPARTYVFGDWERRLLVESSVYRPDEVAVGGSPRLDFVRHETVDRDLVRAELGVAPGDRMVVVSGTWGTVYRLFHYPICLDRILDRPLDRVHLVVKLHPSERDQGPYRAVVEGVAAARGFAPPPLTVVQDVDLYRLLAAADAHLGVHSTVLTEAVAAGTLNLIAHTLAAPDLLGYVDAQVAVPVRDGGDLLRALDGRADLLPSEATRRAFLDSHFAPGPAAERIASDLLAWLA